MGKATQDSRMNGSLQLSALTVGDAQRSRGVPGINPFRRILNDVHHETDVDDVGLAYRSIDRIVGVPPTRADEPSANNAARSSPRPHP